VVLSFLSFSSGPRSSESAWAILFQYHLLSDEKTRLVSNILSITHVISWSIVISCWWHLCGTDSIPLHFKSMLYTMFYHVFLIVFSLYYLGSILPHLVTYIPPYFIPSQFSLLPNHCNWLTIPFHSL
jgi:hypothetical protein